MDTTNDTQEQHPKQEPNKKNPPVRNLSPTISLFSPLSNSSQSRRDGQDSILGAVSNVHSSPPEMDGSDGYQQIQALPARDHGDQDTHQKSRRKQSIRPKDSDHLGQGVKSTLRIKPLDDRNLSDLSSRSTSDDVELQEISTEDDMTDDEELGLNAQDKRYRTRRRRNNTQFNQRVVPIDRASEQDKSKADKNFLKALLINALLIASWYLFSLSISIVGLPCALSLAGNRLTWDCSTTPGCSRPVILIFTCLSLRHVCTWLFSFCSPRPFFSSFHDFFHDSIVFQILTTPTISVGARHRTTNL
jgi:hypothetical protein